MPQAHFEYGLRHCTDRAERSPAPPKLATWAPLIRPRLGPGEGSRFCLQYRKPTLKMACGTVLTDKKGLQHLRYRLAEVPICVLDHGPESFLAAIYSAASPL